MAYIGRGINNISNASILDAITFTNSAGPYNLTQNSGATAFTPISVQALVISVDGVIQSPDSYTISAATITFGVSMASSLTNDFIVHNGVGIVNEPSDGSVTTAKIEDLAVTSGKLAADSVITAKVLDSNITYAKIQDTTTANRVIGAATAGVVSEVQVVDDMTNFVSTASAPGLTIKGDGSTDGYVALNCDQNTHAIKLKSPPHSAAQTYTLTFPITAPATDKYLQTTSGGQLSFASVTEYNDDALQNDIATLALHQATNANAAKYNLTNTNVDVYQDSTGVATFTDCARDTTGEFISSIVAGTPAAFDYGGVDVADRAQLWRYGFTSGTNSTWYTIGDGTNTNNEENCWNGVAETGGNLYLTGYINTATGSTSNNYMIFDFTNQIQWGDKLKIGKNNTWGDAQTWRVQYSTDNITYTDIDFTGITQSSYFDGSGGTNGQFVAASGTSGGLLSVTANATSNTWATWTLIEGMPVFTARYFKYFNTAMHSSANNNTGFADFIPYTQTDTVNATGNYVSTATTANASVSKVGIVMTYKNNAGTNTLNTDIVAQVSADGGANYSTVTLAAAGTFSTGVLQAVANDVSVTAGTSIQYKISFANQALATKEARITGVSLIY